jgi:hypothetical protein
MRWLLWPLGIAIGATGYWFLIEGLAYVMTR